jgi:hypothetical protein
LLLFGCIEQMNNAEELRLLQDEQAQLAALSPLNIIRTETVLSKLPIHNLAKKGRVDIRIVRRSDAGEVQLKWEVSHSDRYGQPRQLAYKLDTLIVNRRIEEETRPLPNVIRIGSLKEICKELRIGESGKNTNDLRNAFLQNASAFINARLTYRAADGTERRLEAGFTRYAVVFTGEQLPDGRQADAVYITLNQPYWEVVNSAPFRPLNYDYLRELTPGAQRFYEIVSFRIYATLKNNRPHSRLLYSDYCAFSAQQRYFDYERFRVQMYKIHKPHFESGYIKSASFEPTVDGEGKTDWMMIYTPGLKAKAEFATFSKKQPPQLPLLSEENESRREAPPELDEPVLLQELTLRGISERPARKLLHNTVSGQHILDQLEWGDHLIRQSPAGTFHNPPGFYLSLVRDNIRPPENFETSRKRELREEAERTNRERYQARQELEILYDGYLTAELEKAFDAISPDDLEIRTSAKRKAYARQFPNLPSATIEQIAFQAVRTDLRQKLPLLSVEEFAKLHSDHKGH